MQPIISDTGYRHILMMKDGLAMIAGTKIKVEYVVSMTQQGESPEDICEAYAHNGLTLGHVHSALAYYYNNKELVDAQIEEGIRFDDNMRLLNKPYQTSRETLLRRRAEGGKPKMTMDRMAQSASSYYRDNKERVDRNWEEIKQHDERMRKINEAYQPDVARLIREMTEKDELAASGVQSE